ncbi:hypothetical protein [Natrinema soli]|uniref:Uncharacterized protein n=1 Tax=Natrinema soli TaxID=1930624 RepID=A0ABD5SU80_9EURY|nr:hypothetical protein [Natrinema soli]
MPALSPDTVALALPRDDLWVLHHVLLERLDAERTAPAPASIDPPPLAVYRVFDTLEAGETSVRITDLEAVTDVLRHDGACPPWCLGCARLAALRQRLMQLSERQQPSDTYEIADD